MSGAQTSGFADPNILYKTLSGAGYQEVERNRLLNQETQQTIGGNNTEMVARAAATLADPTLYPTEEARAAAYPGMVAQLRANGYAPNAPGEYPGLAHIQAAARMGTPSQTQQEWGFNLAANKAYTNATNPPATAPATSGAPATGGDGLTGDKAHDLPLIAQRESGGSPTVLNYVAQQDPTAYARGATASGKYQIVNSTWRDGMQLAGLDPAQYATAREAPEQVQDKVASALYDKYGAKPWQKGPQDWVKDEQGRYQMATVRPPAGSPGGAPSVTAPGASTAPAPPAPYRVASNAPTPPPASTAPAAQPSYVDRETGLPVLGTQPGAPAPASGQPQAQAQIPQPPPNRSMPGSPDGPPAATPPPAPAAPAGGPQPPQLAPLNAAGLTPIQQRQIDALAADPRVTLEKRMAAQQALANQNIQLQQKAFSDWIQVQQLQTSQGQLSVSQQNSALEYWKAGHPDAKVTMTGGEIITQNPRTGEEIAPRIQVTPQRADTAAMAIVSRLGPKVANGTATPDEQAQYAVAVDSYRQPALRENPVTKETVRVNTRELPAGFPEPPGLGGRTSGGTGAAGGSNVVMPGYSPQQQEIERNKGRYDIAADDLRHDRGEIAAIGDAGRSAQQDNLRVQEMRDILTNANTGPGTETAAHLRAWIARWTPGQLAAWDGSGANLSNPAAIEMFQKLGFVGAVTQERGSTPRGGYQATKMFQQFNPGAQLLTSTNQGLLAQRLIANQAEADYAQAAQDHYNTQRERLKSPEQNYDPLSSFDAKWQAQRNPQVYAAAIGALGGQDGDMWSKDLSKDEIQRVKEVVTRADPKAVINMPGDAPTGRKRPPLTSFQR